MMTALATIIKVDRRGPEYNVMLSCEQQTSCSSCSSQKSCGTGVVSKALGNKTLSWHLTTAQQVKVGQVVEIGFPESSLIYSAMIVYLLPLCGLILGALIGHFFLVPFFSAGERPVIIASAIFTGASIWLAKYFSCFQEEIAKHQVTLVRVLGESIQ